MLAWVVLALFFRTFVVEAFQIPGGSMQPTLQIRDHIFVNKFVYGPRIPLTKTRLFSARPPDYGDVVLFEHPFPPGVDYIKRTIALPGDTLEVHGGHPVINGWTVPNCRVGSVATPSPFSAPGEDAELTMEFLGDVAYLTLTERSLGERAEGPYHVKEGEFWVLGDNRDQSFDSRAWRNGLGAGVPFENVRGRAMSVWLALGASTGDSGGVTWELVSSEIHGEPRLPKDATEELRTGIERCLKTRPAQTRPPAPSGVARPASR